MAKKKRNIIIWALTWAVLFLVVAYSPIGRPDLYVGTTSYYSYNQGVNFKGGIANAPTSKSSTIQTDDAEIEPTTYTPLAGNEGTYEGSASKFDVQNSVGAAIQDNKSTNYSQQGGVALAVNTTRQQAQGKATAQNGDVSSLSSSLTLNSTATTSTRQTAPVTRSNGGGTDIGGDPENPNAIPVGDGLWTLLVMVGVYTFWRQRQATKLKTSRK